MPRLAQLTPLLPLVLTTISFAFILVSLTSPSWSIQKSYDPTLDMTDWAKPLFTRQRSPFQICEAARDDSTSSANATNSTTTTTYTVSCQKYAAYGTGKTSCETVFALKSYDQARAGDERLCQQVHLSGNLVITSTTFITLGFTLTLLLTLLAIVHIKSSSTTPPTANGSEDTPARHPPKTKRSSLTPFLNLAIIASLSIGSLTAILSQFYAIMAFIQSQPPNGAWASGRGNAIDPTQDNASGPWIEGAVVRAYLTVAWVFAGAGAVVAGSVWRLPRWEKL